MDYQLSQDDGGKLYIPVMETPYQVIRVDNVAGEQIITVYNIPLSHIDDLIAKLQELKTANQPKTITSPYPAQPSKIIEFVDSDEPEEMTTVLGQKPDPTAWYKNAITNAAQQQKVEKEADKTWQAERPQRIELPTPPMPKPQRGNNIINVIGVPTKPYRARGYDIPAKPDANYNADIIKNQSIRIYGIGDARVTFDKATNTYTSGKPAFDLTFKVGDYAVYGSYNLVYTGKIIAIGEKTVKIKHYEHSDKTTQLDLHTFISRNHDYDAEKIAKRNSEWSD